MRYGRLFQTALEVSRFVAMTQWAVTVVAVQFALATPGGAFQQTVAGEASAVETAAVDAGERIDSLLTSLVLEHLPHDFVDEKKWGRQDERWDGVDVDFKDGKLRTHRRKKMVNHGTWKRYTAELMNPKEEFAVSVTNMRQAPDGKMTFDVQCDAHVKLHARQSKWVKGVQLYSLSADGHAKVSLQVSLALETHLDITKFPPDLIFDPAATAAEIIIKDFRIDRISKAGGEFAQQVSRSVRSKLDEKIDEKEQKLVEKLNRKFKEKRKDLRLSISEAIKSKWAEPAKEFLPAPVRGAIEQFQ